MAHTHTRTRTHTLTNTLPSHPHTHTISPQSCSDLPGNQFIWCHEWEKHGTCAYQIPDLNTERKFFSGVLKLFVEKMNYDTHVLAKHGIVPSTAQPYPVIPICTHTHPHPHTHTTTSCRYNILFQVDRIVDAFQSEWHVHPVLQCYPQRKV